MIYCMMTHLLYIVHTLADRGEGGSRPRGVEEVGGQVDG